MKLMVSSGRVAWPIVALIVAPIILLAPIVLLGRVLYWGVPLLQFYPWQHTAVESLRVGQLPMWNSLVGSGAPLAANLQSGVFYPLNVLYLILPAEYAMSYTAALHVILAGLFMYAFMRALQIDAFAALIAALAYQLCGFVIARLSFFSMTAAFPWIAAWLWRSEKLVESAQRFVASGPANQQISESANQRDGKQSRVTRCAIRDALWLALTIGLGVLAGHAQTAVYGLILIAAYFVWRTFTLSPRHLVTSSLVAFAIAVVLGLSLAAIQLLPAAELTRESQRAGGLDPLMVLTHSFWPPRLLALLSPDFFGNPAQNNFWGYDNYWENAAYIGVMPLLLAMWAVWRTLRGEGRGVRGEGRGARGESANQQITRHSSLITHHSLLITRHSSLVTFFAIAAILSLLLAFGWFTPIYPFLYQSIPGFDLFQGPARWLVVTLPALCALAGIGAQHWIDRGFSRRAARRWTLIGMALTLAGAAGFFIFKDQSATFGPAVLRFGVLLVIVSLLFKSPITNYQSQITIVLVLALDLITAHFALNPSLPPDVYHAPNPAADAIRADGNLGRVFYFAADEEAIKFGKYLAHDKKFDGYGPTDLDYWLGERAALLPNSAMIDGVSSANNFDSLIIGRYQNVLDKINALPIDEALPLLGRMNVAYLVSPRALDLPIVYRGRAVTIYRNPAVLPRAWIAPIESDLTQVSSVRVGSSIESLTDSGNTVTIRAASPGDGWLILVDTWYPGWSATVDGTPTDIQLANEAFRAVRFPVGAHQVEFRYAPMSLQAGELISLVSTVVIIIGLATTNKPFGNQRISESTNETN